MRTWAQAWQEALYGPSGFYRQAAGPASHFATSTHGEAGSLVAQALVTLARRERLTAVVDVGAGRGELLAAIHAVDPELTLTGVDVVDRPAGLAPAIDWVVSPGGAALPTALSGLRDTLIVANEWLDVVPCVIAAVAADGTLQELLEDGTPGQPVCRDDLAWADRWWPVRAPRDVVEIGRSRDLAWADLLSRLTSGVAIAIDYGHVLPDRPRDGTLAAYRHGREVPVTLDSSVDITAHVAIDALAHDELLTQRDALTRLGMSTARPSLELARTEPAAYLHALSRAGATAALLDPQGLGGFWWAIARRR